MSIFNTAHKGLWNSMVDRTISESGLSVLCSLYYGDTKHTDCPNCIYDANTERSSNIYNNTGDMPFEQGVCPYCHGLGKLPDENNEDIYMSVIFNSKSWLVWNDDSVSPHSPDMFVQSISQLSDSYNKIKKAKYAIISDDTSNYSRSKYERYGEPQPVGLGNSRYILTMWKKI